MQISNLIGIARSTATWLALLPVMLHLIDKVMEKFSPFGEKVLRAQMAESPQSIVQEVGASKERFDSVRVYFDFDRRCHFVTNISIFNILSLYVFQLECTGKWLCFIPSIFIPILSFSILLISFLLALANRKFHPAAASPRATRNWERIAIGSFLLALSIELFLRLGTGACEREENLPSAVDRAPTPVTIAPVGWVWTPVPPTFLAAGADTSFRQLCCDVVAQQRSQRRKR
jgi:hypothetical protein